MMSPNLKLAVHTLEQGGLIAYPTEAVYGLGCDPLNATAVARLNALKGRPSSKGLILIGASWEHLKPYTAAIPEERLNAVLATWPGPYTWIFPAADHLPSHLKSNDLKSTIALRWTAHPLAQALCASFGRPIVSTSANRTGEEPLRTAAQVQEYFAQDNIFVLDGKVGDLKNPTTICHALSGEVIRKS